MKEKIKEEIGIGAIIVLFILSSYFVQTNLDIIREYLGKNPLSMFVYVDILIIATVIAPVDITALIPVASQLWGWLVTALLSLAGWWIGSIIAFALARKYGVPLVKKFISLEKIHKYENFIPKRNIFWSIVFLRITIPADVLSYALGLFSRVHIKTYALATLLGLAPLAFLLAYIGSLPVFYQIISFVIAVFLIVVVIIIARAYKKKKGLFTRKPKRDKRGGKELNKRG